MANIIDKIKLRINSITASDVKDAIIKEFPVLVVLVISNLLKDTISSVTSGVVNTVHNKY